MSVTCSHLSEIDPDHPCVVTIEGALIATGAWGSGVVRITTLPQEHITLTWQEVKALEEALNLLAHVVTR